MKTIPLFEPPADDHRQGWPWQLPDTPVVYHPSVEWPLISIVTPSFNQGSFLEQTIRSVLMQGYPNLEYIIIDGGSKDESIHLILHYERWLKVWVSEKDRGQADALVKGFRHANGKIYAWINSDDYYEPDTFYKIAKRFLETDADFLSGTCSMIDLENREIQHLNSGKISYRSLIRYWRPHFCPPQPSLFFSSYAWKELGGLDTSLNYAMDYDFWLRAVDRYKFASMPDRLSYYRVHENSKTGSEGGFRKFLPEWKRLIRRSLKDHNLFTRTRFLLEQSAHSAKRMVSAGRLRNFGSKIYAWIRERPVYTDQL